MLLRRSCRRCVTIATLLGGPTHEPALAHAPTRVWACVHAPSQYIGRPLLLDGLKFDLRLYALVTSVGGEADGAPLRAFLCREGMVRFAVERFDDAKMSNVHAHLTSASID